MKLLVVSDKESPYLYDHFDKEKFSNIDLILSCGDLKPAYLSYLVTMINAPLYYVHGNHDDHYIKTPPEGCESIDGKLVVFQGIRILGIGGSRKYREGLHQYSERQMTLKVAKLYPQLLMHQGMDILLTHSPALGLGDGTDPVHVGFPQFNKLLDRYDPKLHLHGHQHLNYGYNERIRTYHNTTIINGYGYHLINY
jgi:Icc-related predicted phosphoesterase